MLIGRWVSKPLAIHTDAVIREHAVRRLAEVFRVPESSLSNDMRFGHELQAAPASDLKANEFDVIDDDIKGVADRQLLKAMAQGRLEICTVGDYCEHMIRCNAIKPKEVTRLLR
jgi:hypothetical protein